MKNRRIFQITTAVLFFTAFTFTACNKDCFELPDPHKADHTPSQIVSYPTADNTADNKEHAFARSGSASCSFGMTAMVVGPCNDNGTPQNESDDFYLANLTYFYEGEPGLPGCSLELYGDVIASSVYASGSHTFSGLVLPADGASKTVVAYFSCLTSCGKTITLPAVEPCGCGFPGDRSADPVFRRRARINWAAEPLADKYRVQYKRIGVSEPWTNRETINLHKMINGLEPGTAYKYRVKSHCSYGWSSWSPAYNFITYP